MYKFKTKSKKKKLLLIKYEFDLPRLSKLSFFLACVGTQVGWKNAGRASLDKL